MSDNTIDINNLDDLNNYNSIYKEKKSSLYLLISFIIIIIVCLNVLILYLMIHSSITTNSITTNSIILFATMGTIAFIGILITIFNDKFLKSDLPFLLPPELRNDQNDVSNNNKILANIILLYSLDYIEKKTIDNDVHIIALKKKKDLEVFKNSLNDKFKLLTTKYLDIINYEVNKSREPGTYINRHHAVATQIFKKYVDEKLRLSYFTQFEDEKKITSEYNRIKSLTYEDLENEILENILEVFLNKFENEEQIIKTFDLIQIWGGRPGGNNIYDRQGIDRVNITDWLKTYIDGIEKASKGKFESYKILKSI